MAKMPMDAKLWDDLLALDHVTDPKERDEMKRAFIDELDALDRDMKDAPEWIRKMAFSAWIEAFRKQKLDPSEVIKFYHLN